MPYFSTLHISQSIFWTLLGWPIYIKTLHSLPSSPHCLQGTPWPRLLTATSPGRSSISCRFSSIVGLCSNLYMNIGLCRDLHMDIRLSRDLLMDVGHLLGG